MSPMGMGMNDMTMASAMGCNGTNGVAQTMTHGMIGKKRPRPDDSQIIGQFEGVIKNFNPSSGFGFVESAGVKEKGYPNDVFLHGAHVSGFEVGARVRFTCFLNS